MGLGPALHPRIAGAVIAGLAAVFTIWRAPRRAAVTIEHDDHLEPVLLDA